MIRIIFLVITLILGIIAIYCYIKDTATLKSKIASIILAIFTIFSLIIAIYPTILKQEKIEPSIVLDHNSLELLCGDENPIFATTSPDNAILEWSSSDSEVITVDDNGYLKAINEGTATITATLTYKKMQCNANCVVVVKTPEINIDKSQLLYIGDTYNLSVTTIPENINILWNSSNTNIVTVDDNGKIEAIAEGTVTITAKMIYNDINYSANCDIEVKAPTPVPTPIEESNENINDNIKSNEQEIIDTEVASNDDFQEIETNIISIRDVAWLDDEKIYEEDSATTMRGEEWSDCIRFGSSNINSDGTSVLRAVCDKYNRFTAEFAPQEGFDKSETVTLYVYGGNDEGQTFKEEYQIDYSTKNIMVDVDISNSDELYIWKVGDYNQGRIAGQFINGYTGMGVLMRDATLYE